MGTQSSPVPAPAAMVASAPLASLAMSLAALYGVHAEQYDAVLMACVGLVGLSMWMLYKGDQQQAVVKFVSRGANNMPYTRAVPVNMDVRLSTRLLSGEYTAEEWAAMTPEQQE